MICRSAQTAGFFRAGNCQDSSRHRPARRTASSRPSRKFKLQPQYADLVRGSGGSYRLGFGRPNLCGDVTQQGADITEAAFNRGALCTAFGQNGNLSRNALRAPSQSRLDLGIMKRTRTYANASSAEFGWDIFNVLNRANFAAPDSELGSPDFGRITNTVGGPRVMQFRAKLKF